MKNNMVFWLIILYGAGLFSLSWFIEIDVGLKMILSGVMIALGAIYFGFYGGLITAGFTTLLGIVYGVHWLFEVSPTGVLGMVLVYFLLGAVGGYYRDLWHAKQLALNESREREAATQKSLDRERSKLHTYLNESELMIVILNPLGQIHYINNKGCELLGYTKRTALLGLNWFETFLLVSERERYSKLFKDALESGEVPGDLKFIETHIVTKEKTKRLFRFKNAILKDDAGEPFGLLSTAEDITNARETEDFLVESEIKLRKITSAAQDGIIMINNQGRISFWNPAAENIFGYEEQEVLGCKLYDMIAPDNHEGQLKTVLEKWRNNGEIHTRQPLQTEAMRKDGHTFPMEMSLATLVNQGELYAVGVVRDVTEREKMEAAIKESEEVFRNLAENIPGVVYFSHYDDVFSKIYLNDTIEEITGYPK